MPPASRRARTYDPEKIRTALLAQARSIAEVVAALPPARFDASTRLGDWAVRELVAHIALQIEALPRVLGEEPPAGPADLPLVRWPQTTAALAHRLDISARRALVESPDAAALLSAAVAQLEAALVQPLPDRLVRVWPGTLPAADFAVTRLVELVVHAEDLSAAGGIEVPLDREAVATVVRLLADALADKAPGNSVEVRIPPYAAVQCVEGPRHTRGTPPNVVETDPLTWIRLAAGRTTWGAEVWAANIAASGERADLSPYLPVLS